jgi:hypothetical protein
MAELPISYRGCHLPGAIVAYAVWLYLRFPLSFRDVEKLLAERGIRVGYETVRRWVGKFGSQSGEALRKREARSSCTWHTDEMAVPGLALRSVCLRPLYCHGCDKAGVAGTGPGDSLFVVEKLHAVGESSGRTAHARAF